MPRPAKTAETLNQTPNVESFSNVRNSRKRAPSFILPTRQTNAEAVRSFMIDCLVPILAKEFLRLRSSSEPVENQAGCQKPSFEPLGKEVSL